MGRYLIVLILIVAAALGFAYFKNGHLNPASVTQNGEVSQNITTDNVDSALSQTDQTINQGMTQMDQDLNSLDQTPSEDDVNGI